MRPLFPTPLFLGQVEDLALISFEIESALQRVTWHERTDWGTTHLLSTLDFNTDVVSELELTTLDRELNKAIELHMKDFGFEYESYTRSSWFAKYEKGHYAQVHNHGFTDISGVYYHSVGDKGGRIWFENPCLAAHTSMVFPPDRAMFVPQPGLIIQFPGYLYHGVQSNDSDTTRISLAYNIYFNR